MTWLNGRYLADNKSKSTLTDARLDWEAAMIEWINGMKATEAHRAYYWARFLQDDYKISVPFRIRKRERKRSLSQRDSVTKPGVGTTLGQRSPIFERRRCSAGCGSGSARSCTTHLGLCLIHMPKHPGLCQPRAGCEIPTGFISRRFFSTFRAQQISKTSRIADSATDGAELRLIPPPAAREWGFPPRAGRAGEVRRVALPRARPVEA